MRLEALLELFNRITDPDIISKISIEMFPKIAELKNVKDIRQKRAIGFILNSLANNSEPGRVINALDDDFRSWLGHKADILEKDMKYGHAAIQIKQILTNRLSIPQVMEAMSHVQIITDGKPVPDTPGVRHVDIRPWGAPLTASDQNTNSYAILQIQMQALGALIDSIRASSKGEELAYIAQLIGWKIIGYQQLLQNYAGDPNISKLSQELFNLANIFQNTLGANMSDFMQKFEAVKMDIPKSHDTYAMAESQLVSLPTREMLTAPGVLIDEDPIEVKTNKITAAVAKSILDHLEKNPSSERLVIYRGMGGEEALQILELFNSGHASHLEEILKGGGKVDFHDKKNVAQFGLQKGSHLADRIQAESYFQIQSDHVNVTLAFILKPGVNKLLFSKSIIAIQKKMSAETGMEGFPEASQNEGTAAGYIGIKYEKNNWSLGIAESDKSKVLLQLLVERVEIKRIRTKLGTIYVEWP